MMIRLSGVAILLAVAQPAQASDWFYVDSSHDNSNISFIDKQSIRDNAAGNRLAAMYTVLAQDDDGTSSYLFQIEVDCAGHRSRLLSGESFDARAVSQGVSDMGGGDWESVDPGSQGETITRFICSKGASSHASSEGSALPFARGREMLAARRAGKEN